MELSRRNFLVGAGAVAGAAAVAGLAGCSSDESGSSSESSSGSSEETGISGTAGGVTFDETYDVVVVGAGSSGEFAALEALEAGLSVVVLEALSSQQGSSAFTEANMLICGTDAEDSTATPDDMYDWYVSIGEGRNNEELCRMMADTQTEVYERLLDLGVTFNHFASAAIPTLPWSTQPTEHGAMILNALTTAAEDAGQVSVFNSRARHLVYNADGRIVGVAAEEDGEMKYYGANCGVILATGCFTRNPDLCKTLGTQGFENLQYGTQTGQADNGDSLVMGLEVGADTWLLSQGMIINYILGDDAVSFENARLVVPRSVSQGGGVLLNTRGERFIDESSTWHETGTAALAQPDTGAVVVIYDEPLYQEYGFDVYAGYGVEQKDEGYQFMGETMEDLMDELKASYPDFDTDAILAKMASYNEDAEKGEDPEFHREVVVPIVNPPYYAIVAHGAANGLQGGLRIDGNARVISYETEEPIPGLYAVGMVIGGLMGDPNVIYPVSVLKGLCTGMTAGRAVAADNE